MNRDAVEMAATQLIQGGRASEETLVGCTEDEIASIERLYGLRMPGLYRAFLSRMGRSAGEFLADTDLLFTDLPSLRKEAVELLEEIRAPFKLDATDFVFAVHRGYQFLYFPVTGSEDPPVYHFLEGDDAPKQVYDRFSDWLLGSVADEIA